MGRNRGKTKESLHRYTREWLKPEDLPQLNSELAAASDRACAIVSCAMVDTALANALKTRFVESADNEGMLYGQTAFLGSFSSRIRLGFALGIYGPKATNCLNVLRNVRNAFAHSVRPIDFSHKLVVEQFATWPPNPEFRPEQRRELYIAMCNDFVLQLTQYAEKVGSRAVVIGFELLEAAPKT